VKNSDTTLASTGPRQVYGRLVEELSAQGSKAVAFDVLFGELRSDHPQVQMADGGLMESDEFFASQMYLAGNVLIPINTRCNAAKPFRHQCTGPRRHFHGKRFRRRFTPGEGLFASFAAGIHS